MERLWAPWRLDYLKRPPDEEPPPCVFCHAATLDDATARIVHRGATCYALLNLYPYTNGHLLVAPYRHLGRPGELDAAERAELWELFDHALGALERVSRPHGVNAGLNLGRAAGAGVEDHLHLHVVPRWNGDTNFMPVLSDTRVMPQHLDATWEAIRAAWIQ